eukprot:scaffold846_cov252-Pinguiococcus_pyrenoidosus.AAC.41
MGDENERRGNHKETRKQGSEANSPKTTAAQRRSASDELISEAVAVRRCLEMADFDEAASAADVLKSLASKSRQQEALSSASAHAKTAQEDLERARAAMERLDATVMTKSEVVADWSKAYTRWEDFEDLENLEVLEKLAREKQEAALKQQMMGCSHDHSTEQAIFDLSTAEKIRACDGFRRHGNEFFREAQWARALGKYDLALAYYEYAFPDTDDEAEILSSIRVACLLNACLCHLRLRRRRDALNTAKLAVIAAPDSPKALYRRAQAYNELDLLEDAKEDLQAALRLRPNEPEFRRELAAVLSKESAAKRSMTSISQSFLHLGSSDGGLHPTEGPPGTGSSLEALLSAKGKAATSRQEPETKRRMLDDLYEIPPDLTSCFESYGKELSERGLINGR